MKKELDITTTEQIVKLEDVKMTPNSFDIWSIAIENKIDFLKRSGAISRFKPEITKGFAKDQGTIRNHVSQLMETHNETGTEVEISFTTIDIWHRMRKLTCLLCQRTLSFLITELVPRRPNRSRSGFFHNTMMTCQPQVMRIVGTPRRSLNPIVQV